MCTVHCDISDMHVTLGGVGVLQARRVCRVHAGVGFRIPPGHSCSNSVDRGRLYVLLARL